jgi:hypothetical protein
MSDDAERRRRRQFEPPPWEQEGLGPAADQEEGATARLQAPTDGAEGPAVRGDAAASSEPDPVPAVDDRQVAAMLIDLSCEEGSARRSVVQAGKTTAKALVALGVMMMLIAAVLAVRSLSASSGTAGTAVGSKPGVSQPAQEMAGAKALEGGIGAAVIAVMGAFVAGFAGWMWVRANREQGS